MVKLLLTVNDTIKEFASVNELTLTLLTWRIWRTANKASKWQMAFNSAFKELKITNIFFGHKEIHKMTWSTQGYRSIIHYILTNKKLSPLVNDTNVLRGYGVTTDHYLLISKIRLLKKWYTFTKTYLRQEEIFRYIC